MPNEFNFLVVKDPVSGTTYCDVHSFGVGLTGAVGNEETTHRCTEKLELGGLCDTPVAWKVRRLTYTKGGGRLANLNRGGFEGAALWAVVIQEEEAEVDNFFAHTGNILGGPMGRPWHSHGSEALTAMR